MKKILYISNHNPFAISYGAEQRSNILLRAFIQNDCQVDVAYIGKEAHYPDKTDKNVSVVYWNEGNIWSVSRVAALKRLCLLNMFPCSKSLASIIDALLREKNYDFIVCRYLPFAALAGLDRYADKLMLDIDDLPAQAIVAHLSKKKGIGALYQKLLLRRIQVETLNWIRKTHVCFLPNSDQAAQYGCVHLPNIPILEAVKSLNSEHCQNLLFIGKLDWRPNYEGVAYFVRHCWNEILSRCPSARLLVAGKGLPDSLKEEFLNIANIEVLGFVDSLSDFYNRGNIVISPIYSGAGTNIKVAEAMAMGKACVLTPFSSKGYEQLLRDGENVFIAENEDDMVRKILMLLESDALCLAMRCQSHTLASLHFSQSRVNKIIYNIINSNRNFHDINNNSSL